MALSKVSKDMFVESKIFVPTGHVITYPSTSVPAGYLKCNGAQISRTTYADLFDAIGTKYGVGDGTTTFELPDFRAGFMRGYDDLRGVDVDRVNFEDEEAQQSNILEEVDTSLTNGTTGVIFPTDGTWSDLVRYEYSAESAGFRWKNSTDEAYPRNIALLMCIKY
jgi:hypothetical protein